MARAAHDFVIVVPVADRPEHLADCLDSLAELLRRYPYAGRVEVLIADDPFAGLDPVTEQSIADLLMEVSEGRTLIVSLPDPVGALPIERRVRFVNGAVTA